MVITKLLHFKWFRNEVHLRPIHTQNAVPMPFPCHAVPLRV